MPPKLILEHIFEKQFLKHDNTEEILTMFPHDVASTIAISSISCFNAKGELETLNSPQRFEWTLQAAAYCVTLPIYFQQSLENALLVFRHWMLNNVIECDVTTRNVYARRMMRYLSNIFEFQYDKAGTENRAKLILLLLSDFDNFVKSCKEWFEPTTYNELIRIIIGCCDYLLQEKSQKTFPSATLSQLLRKIFTVLFNTLCGSALTDSDIWDLYRNYSIQWSKLKEYVMCWREKLASVFQKTCRSEDSELSCFQLKELIQGIDLQYVLDNAHLFDELGGLLHDLYVIATTQTHGVYYVKYPASVFFQLFGNWIFTAFRKDPCPGHNIIMQTLLNLCGTMYLPKNSPWMPVIMNVVNNAASGSNHPMIVNSLSSGYSMVNKFYSDKLCSQFLATAEQLKAQSICISEPGFWYNYSHLLTVISERRKVEQSLLEHVISQSTNMNAIMNVLLIMMRQYPETFSKVVIEQYQTNSMNIIALNSLIASYMPFVKFHNMKDIFIATMEAVWRNREMNRVLQTFLVLLLQVIRFTNDADLMADDIIKFLTDMYYHKYSDNFHHFRIAKRLCGRPVSRTSETKPKLVFMISNRSLVSVLEDDTIEVRDSRGKFTWVLSEQVDKRDVVALSQSGEIGDLSRTETEDIKLDVRFDIIDEVRTKLEAIDYIDPEFRKQTHYNEMDYLKKFTESKSDREKAINFLVESGLYQNVMKIEDPVDEVIAKFDEIEDTSLINIPLVQIGDATDSEASTAVKHVLGGEHCMGSVRINFEESTEPTGDVFVVINDTPFDVNPGHESVPKGKLVFFIQPYNSEMMEIQCHCTEVKLRYWNALEAKRLVHINQLLAVISSAIFRFFELKNDQLFFEKDKQREALLMNVNTRAMRLIEIIEDGAFNVK